MSNPKSWMTNDFIGVIRLFLLGTHLRLNHDQLLQDASG